MTLTGRVLLVDDEEKIVKTLGRALREEGHLVTTTSRAIDGQRLLAEQSFDVLIIDYRMPDRSGMDVVKELVATTPESERPAMVMMTAHGSVESAVEAMKLGAHDYLQKPFEVDELLLTARRALAAQRARTELTYLRSERDAEFDYYGIVGRSKVMVEISRRIELVAQSRSTVLLTGETGTGKELVARAIHDRSQQRHLPLIKVNCAAIPGDADRVGAVRPRPRRLHRRDLGQEGPLRARRRRHHLPRRDRHARRRRCSRSCCACCRSASSSRSGRNAPRRSTCG